MRDSRNCLSLVLVLAHVMLIACGKPAPPIPPSLELPKPVSDLHAYRKGNNVTLTWTVPSRTTEGQAVRHLGKTRICRGLEAAPHQCAQIAQIFPAQPGSAAVGNIKKSRPAQGKHKPQGQTETEQRVEATYTDVLSSDLQNQNPIELATYSVETLNEDGRSGGLSNPAQVPLAPTLPMPADLRTQLSADGITLSWKGSVPGQIPGLTYLYRIYRREQGTNIDNVASEIQVTGTPDASFTDRGFEWNKTYEYYVTAVSLVGGPSSTQVEGENSLSVSVAAIDKFPAAVPSGVQAVFSGVGQQPFIDLTWTPATEADLAGYNIYRHEEGQPSTRINPLLVSSPAFRDSDIASGRKYFYSVSSVDVRGNESARSEETSETVP